jgi:hypothetical protein
MMGMNSQPPEALGAVLEYLPRESHPAHPSHLLIVDCETRRFTIESVGVDGVGIWYQEVNRAVTAGRKIFCVPVHDGDTGEVARLNVKLGYDQWPSKTIVAAPHSNSNDVSCRTPVAVKEHHSQSRPQKKKNNFDWLNAWRETRRLSRVS